MSEVKVSYPKSLKEVKKLTRNKTTIYFRAGCDSIDMLDLYTDGKSPVHWANHCFTDLVLEDFDCKFTELGSILYIDSPSSFHEIHQIASKPGPVDKFFKDDQAWTGEERYLPPGTERPYADDHARRKIQLAQKPLQESMWRMVGIRPSYFIGKWITKVQLVNRISGEGDWPIEAPIESVTYDFLNNETLINGLTSHLART